MSGGGHQYGRDEERRRAAGRSDADGQVSELRRDTVGPQGAALIRELQRIQRAFDQEYHTAPAKPRKGPQADAIGRSGKPNARRRAASRKNRKGMMGRAVDACLERFGFGQAPPVETRPAVAKDLRPPVPIRPPRHLQAVEAVLPRIPPPTRAPRDIEREPVGGALRLPNDPAQPPRDVIPAPIKNSSGRMLSAALRYAAVGWRYLVSPEHDTPGENANDAELATRIRCAFDRELKIGLRVLIIGLGIGGGWATLVPLAGAVAVTANLVVQSNVKKIQHPTGGIVAQIAVHDGMHVQAGDLVVRLDETQVRANLQVVSKQLDEVLVRIARLVAERDGLDAPQLPPELAAQSYDEDLKTRLASETSLFKARVTARQSQKDLLKSRIAQLQQQIDGFEAQVKSNASQVELIASELQGVQTLFDQRLAPITRLHALQRDSARLDGERGQLQSSIAETKSKIGEAQLQMIRVDQDFRADVIKELREAEAKQAELTERRIAAQDQLNRIDIRAPTSGVVHQLAIHTVGGVIGAGQVVMEIVPDSDELQVEARLPPNDVDQVKVGQTTLVRFSAFNQRTTPQLSGVVSYVSADLSRDQQNGTSYYTVRVTLPEEEHRRLNGLQLVSGMPAEIFVQTGSRTMMSYLLKPIREQLGHAFNER